MALSEQFVNENAQKYGTKENDLIVSYEFERPFFAILFCAMTAKKYATRIANTGGKPNDNEKIIDYRIRQKELCEKYAIPYFEEVKDYCSFFVIIKHIWKEKK